MANWRMIPVVGASGMPHDVIDWCEENDISHHYNNSVAMVEDDGNPMAAWLKEIGVPKVKQSPLLDKKGNVIVSEVTGKELKDPWYDWMVAIIAT